jgi:hypothetical protein
MKKNPMATLAKWIGHMSHNYAITNWNINMTKALLKSLEISVRFFCILTIIIGP